MSSLRIVSIGGGTGLSTLLRGLKSYVDAEGLWSVSRLSAIVTVTDEGGSSGVIRREFAMLPPGDIRNCIVALAEEEQLLSRLFAYRFDTDSLRGHSLGNLLLAALTDITGDFDSAILAASEVLAIRGDIFPSTLQDIRLKATTADGSVLDGEVEISGHLLGEEVGPRPEHARIVHLQIDPPDAKPVPAAIQAIEDADLVLIGPGSLFTSILPNLVIKDLGEAIRNTRALRVYICNVMTQPGETDGFTAEDHLSAIIEHAGRIVDTVVINGRRPSEMILQTYAAKHQFPVQFNVNSLREMGTTPFFGDIISEGDFVRHDPEALAQTIFRLWDRYGRNSRRTGTVRRREI
jgi:uncharacterized cofD-like protein